MPAPPVNSLGDEARRALFAQTMKIAARNFDLINTVPERFKKRGWPIDDRLAIVTMALCCVAIRRPDVKIEVFVGTDDPPCWKAIVGSSTAQKIVDSLEVGDLIRSKGGIIKVIG